MTRKEILAAAEKGVCGDREPDYGIPENNFRLIAESNYHLQVSLIRTQLLHKVRVLHLYMASNSPEESWKNLIKLNNLVENITKQHGLCSFVLAYSYIKCLWHVYSSVECE